MHGNSQGEATVPVTSLGGLVTLAVPESLPEGASPRTYNTDYNVGQAKTRDGLTRVYNQATGSVGPNNGGTVASSTWNNTVALLSSTAGFANHVFLIGINSNSVDTTEFSFALSSSDTVTGIQVQVQGYASASANLIAQLISGGVVVATKSIALPLTSSLLTFGSLTDLWGAAWADATVNAVTFGVRLILGVNGRGNPTGYAQNIRVTLGINTGSQTMQPLGTFTNQNGLRYNLVVDQGGNLWVESLDTAPNVLTLSRSGIAPGSMAVAIEGEGVEYMAFVNPLIPGGADMPLQWTPTYADRITQVGPGAAPVFTPLAGSSDTYPISTITQPPAQSDPADPGHLQTVQQSLGPSSTAPGNVVTIFYARSDLYAQDAVLATAFNSGQAVYVYVSGTSLASANGTFLITSIGNLVPPGGQYPRWYFTYQVAGAPAYQQFGGPDTSPGTYQLTLATLTTSAPVPGLSVGNNITISGASVTAWDSTWPISQAINSSQMVITGTQVAASIATFNYALSGGSTSPPAVGQLVTITGTTNADGDLNLVNATIATATGGSTGSFTVPVSVVTASFAPEEGLATTAGTIFAFDPGLTTVGTSGNPIFGNAIGGTLTFLAATAQLIGTGTKQGSVFFILRDGSYTFPAPPVNVDIPENTTGLLVSQVPIGPPNVRGRGIILTESGQDGVPGANFFTLPNPVQYFDENVSYTATSFFINDNTSTSVTLTFPEDVLTAGLAVDRYGYNLFNLIEIGDPVYISSYDSRNCYGQPLNKIQNLVNMSFDGGYLQATNPLPLGWTLSMNGKLNVSPIFGNSYYISNPMGSLLAQAGLIQQTAYLDAYQQPIFEPNTGYSVRVTARCPSGITSEGGSLVYALVSGGTILGSFSLPFSEMTSSFARFTGVLLPELTTIPANTMLQIYASNLPAGGDVEIDRGDVFETDIPVLTTTEYWSYAGLPTMVDAVTGEVLYTSENQQPVQCATVLYDTHYVAKGWLGTSPGSSLYSLQASPSLEPADWDEPEVSQRSGGAVGPFAWAGGEQWFTAASRAGLFLFVGGQPGKINQEVQQVWDAINWNAGGSIWTDINLKARRLMVGIPLPTPNFWLPNAPVNASPTSPNVVLMLNFQGLDSGEALKGEPQMHTTMFGTLAAIDMRRKWSLWYGGVQSPYATTVQGPEGEQTRFGNGQGNSLVYYLDSTQNSNDNGVPIDSLYTSSGLPAAAKRESMPQLGPNRVQWDYIVLALTSGGTVNLRLLANRLFYPEPARYRNWTVPGGFAPTLEPLDDAEGSLNFIASRTFFEYRQNDGNPGWTLDNFVLRGRKAVWNAMLGFK